MTNPKQAEVQKWIDSLDSITDFSELPSDSKQAFFDLIGNTGFEVLLGLLIATRQGYYLQLSKMPLGTAERSAAASVIQGTISGIELVVQTVLEQCIPSSPAENKGA